MSDMYIMEEDMSIELDVDVVMDMDMDMVEVAVAVAVVMSDMSIMVDSIGKPVSDWKESKGWR